ncbi:MAG: transposase [Coriobacteriaceae bacterium]
MVQERHLRGCIGLQCCCPAGKGFGRIGPSLSHEFGHFTKLLENHMKGIISHARVHISSGKVEGTNQMIKTLRRKGYGYPDDEYFFLKIIDASRKFS